MSEIKVNKISPATGTDITLGDTSDKFIVPSGAELEVASGATITNVGTATNFGGGAWTVIKNTDIASNTSSLEFVDGASGVTFDNTYRMYVVAINGLRPETDGTRLQCYITDDTGSTWKTTGYGSISNSLWCDNYTGAGVSDGNADSDSNTFIHGQQKWGSSTSNGGGGLIYFENPSDTVSNPHVSYFSFWWGRNNSADVCLSHGVGSTPSGLTSYDGIKLFFSSGDISRGHFTLYGLTYS